jgi:hypothetical protein
VNSVGVMVSGEVNGGVLSGCQVQAVGRVFGVDERTLGISYCR